MTMNETMQQLITSDLEKRYAPLTDAALCDVLRMIRPMTRIEGVETWLRLDDLRTLARKVPGLITRITMVETQRDQVIAQNARLQQEVLRMREEVENMRDALAAPRRPNRQDPAGTSGRSGQSNRQDPGDTSAAARTRRPSAPLRRSEGGR
jgi:hypothetical protein